MTRASARRASARAGIGRRRPLENREDRLDLGFQIAHRFGRQGPPRLRLELPAAPVLLDLLPRALDGVLLRVQQVLDQHDELDLAALVDAVPGAVLGWVQEPELALPIAEHVRVQVGELADLPNREELLNRMGGAHRHCSALRSRSIRSAIACRGALPRNRTSATCSAIGSSTPWRRPSSTAARAVLTPSATDCFPASACSTVRPWPMATPRLRLRDKAPVAVRMRSPIPASPANVRGFAPSATPNRVISARPRVITAARVLYPNPRPSRIPAATAMTFLSAPPSSTPMASVVVYTRNCAVAKTCWTRRATLSSRAAATTAVGWRRYTSSANEGPESTATAAAAPNRSARTQDSGCSCSGSSPLDTLTISGRPATAPATSLITGRTACEGAAETRTSASRTAVAISSGARISGASAAPGRNTAFTCSRLMPSTTSGSRAHRVTSSPLRARRSARVVPHAPPPTTATRVMRGSPCGCGSGFPCPRAAGGCWRGARTR